MRVAGKTAFVTSAGAGIGRASALALAREGAKVCATDINPEALASLKAEHPGIETFTLDCMDPAAIAAAPGRTAVPDILVSASGFVHHGTVLDVDDAEFDRSFGLNVKAHFRLIRAFLPGMLKKGGGSIVTIASVAGSIKGAPNRAVYGATKAALIGLAKSVAADFIKQNIRCNAVCPGTIDTPSLRGRIAALGGGADAMQAFLSRQPTGRFGTAEEIAQLVLFLASDESSFITGQTHVIDGGWSL